MSCLMDDDRLEVKTLAAFRAIYSVLDACPDIRGSLIEIKMLSESFAKIYEDIVEEKQP